MQSPDITVENSGSYSYHLHVTLLFQTVFVHKYTQFDILINFTIVQTTTSKVLLQGICS